MQTGSLDADSHEFPADTHKKRVKAVASIARGFTIQNFTLHAVYWYKQARMGSLKTVLRHLLFAIMTSTSLILRFHKMH